MTANNHIGRHSPKVAGKEEVLRHCRRYGLCGRFRRRGFGRAVVGRHRWLSTYRRTTLAYTMYFNENKTVNA